jgi:hypothetical protein
VCLSKIDCRVTNDWADSMRFVYICAVPCHGMERYVSSSAAPLLTLHRAGGPVWKTLDLSGRVPSLPQRFSLVASTFCQMRSSCCTKRLTASRSSKRVVASSIRYILIQRRASWRGEGNLRRLRSFSAFSTSAMQLDHRSARGSSGREVKPTAQLLHRDRPADPREVRGP